MSQISDISSLKLGICHVHSNSLYLSQNNIRTIILTSIGSQEFKFVKDNINLRVHFDNENIKTKNGSFTDNLSHY